MNLKSLKLDVLGLHPWRGQIWIITLLKCHPGFPLQFLQHISLKNIHQVTGAGSPGLVVMGRDSHSRLWVRIAALYILDGHFYIRYIVVKSIIFEWKRPKINEKEARNGTILAAGCWDSNNSQTFKITKFWAFKKCVKIYLLKVEYFESTRKLAMTRHFWSNNLRDFWNLFHLNDGSDDDNDNNYCSCLDQLFREYFSCWSKECTRVGTSGGEGGWTILATKKERFFHIFVYSKDRRKALFFMQNFSLRFCRILTG